MVTAGNQQGLVPAARLQHGVPASLEDLADQIPHHVLVLRHKHGFQPSGHNGGDRPGPFRRLHEFVDGRKVDLDRRPFIDFAVDPDAAAALLDDSVDGREPEAGPLRLGGEKGLEEVGLDLLAHPGPSVAHRQYRVDPRLRKSQPVGFPFAQIYACRPDDEAAPLRHRLPGIDHQVHDHLLDLARIGFQPHRVPAELGDQLDVLPDQAAQHGLEVGDDAVQVQHLRLEHLPAAERQELAREGGRPDPGAPDLLDFPPHRVAVADSLLQELAVAGDRRQQVVEIVGDAARQPPHRFHLLRLAELLLALAERLLRTPAGGDVGDDGHDAGDGPAGVVQRPRGYAQVDLRAVLPAPANLDVGECLPAHGDLA